MIASFTEFLDYFPWNGSDGAVKRIYISYAGLNLANSGRKGKTYRSPFQGSGDSARILESLRSGKLERDVH